MCSRNSITSNALPPPQQQMPEARAFGMLQIMDEMRPFLSYHGNQHLRNALAVVYTGDGRTQGAGQKDPNL